MSTLAQQGKHGQIRKMCKQDCPEYCENNVQTIQGALMKNEAWEYYDGNDEDNEWHTDDTMNLHCLG